MPLTIAAASSTHTLPVRGRVLREVFPPPQIDSERRVDLPEIQAPYRVSFSEQAKAAAAMTVNDSRQSSSSETTARALKLYREVDEL